MLNFFRKYEKYFFIMITIIIVVSFSFFGTYSTLEKNKPVELTAFKAVDGNEIKRRELDEMTVFLGTDAEDKLLFGGVWGPNFLNDGVIKEDFLETGLAQILAAPFLEALRPNLETRLQREKKFRPYENPQAPFISAVGAWNVLAPKINIYLKALRNAENPSAPKTFDDRVQLFLAQRQFPQPALRYLLRHQETQYGWVKPDPNLSRTDLSLFGYHTLNDWFGHGFIDLAGEFIINSAIIAEQRGYYVSDSEALSDLYRNAEISYRQNSSNPNLGVATMPQYFEEQLRRMNMNQNQAVEIWRKVLLFRRLFHDLGSSVFVDPFAIREFDHYAKETIKGELYTLPKALRLGDFHSLEAFEFYLQAVSSRPKEGKELLNLPEKFKTPEEVAKKYPELVQRRYLLEYSRIDKKDLQVKVGVKETWEWEAEEKNWDTLKKKFPEIAAVSAKTGQDRENALDGLDRKTRAKVDAFARNEIVDAHPEWLNVALEAATAEKSVVDLHMKGKIDLFPGLKNPQSLIDLLEKYPETKEQLAKYTPDDETYYRIHVLDRSPNWEILTFAEADKDGILNPLLDQYLKKTEGKPFEKILEAIAAAAPAGKPKEMIADYASSLRLYPYMQQLRDDFKKDPAAIKQHVVEKPFQDGDDKLPSRLPLWDQWKIEQIPYTANRGTSDIPIGNEEAFSLKAEEWSPVHSRLNGEIAFMYVEKRYVDEDHRGLSEKILNIQRPLSIEAQKELMRQLMKEMEAKEAFSLPFQIKEDK